MNFFGPLHRRMGLWRGFSNFVFLGAVIWTDAIGLYSFFQQHPSLKTVCVLLPQPGFWSLLLPICQLFPHTYYRDCDLEPIVTILKNRLFFTAFLIEGLIPLRGMQTFRSILKHARTNNLDFSQQDLTVSLKTTLAKFVFVMGHHWIYWIIFILY